MTDKSDSDLVADVVEVGAAVAIAPPGTKVLTALVTAAPKAIRELRVAQARRRRKRGVAYVQAYLAGEELDEVRAEAEMQALGAEPTLRDIVFDSLRVIDDAMAEEAVFVMGRLTRRYRSNGYPADHFSRGVRRVMRDITSADFAALRELLSILSDLRSDRDGASVAFHAADDPPNLTVYYWPAGQGEGARIWCPTKSPVDNMARAVEQLRSSLISQEGASRSASGLSGGDHMIVSLSEARGLLSLMP